MLESRVLFLRFSYWLSFSHAFSLSLPLIRLLFPLKVDAWDYDVHPPATEEER